MSHKIAMEAWVARIESGFREIGGLQLTERQLQRLWTLDERTCQAVVKVLLSRGVLVKDLDTRMLALTRETRVSHPTQR